MHTDARGVFVEMLKTKDSDNFFTAKPGITRGGHYHHTKTEKFLSLNCSFQIQECSYWRIPSTHYIW